MDPKMLKQTIQAKMDAYNNTTTPLDAAAPVTPTTSVNNVTTEVEPVAPVIVAPPQVETPPVATTTQPAYEEIGQIAEGEEVEGEE